MAFYEQQYEIVCCKMKTEKKTKVYIKLCRPI